MQAESNSTFHSEYVRTLAKPGHILVATDLSDISGLIPHVVAQAKASNAKVTLVHAILPANVYPGDFPLAARPDQEALDRNAISLLEGFEARIAVQGVRCDIVLKHGYAHEVVAEQVKSTGASRLILGSHGRGKFGQMVLGSVTNSLLGEIQVPVFVVGPELAASALHVTPRVVLHPTSLAGDYRPSLEMALAVARSYNALLTVLHIIENDGLSRECRARAILLTEKEIHTALARIGAQEAEVKVKVSDDDLVEEILDVSTEIMADWIVLGINSAFRPFQNSLAYKVIAHSACGVLAVRHEPDEIGVATLFGELSCSSLG